MSTQLRPSTLVKSTAISLVLALNLLSAPLQAQTPVLEEIKQLAQQGKIEQALILIHSEILRSPADPNAQITRAQILANSNRSNEAISQLEGWSRQYPNHPEIYNQLAILHLQQGNPAKAQQVLQRAVQRAPEHTQSYERLGDIYLKRAQMAYQTAFELDESSQYSESKLGLITDLFAINDSTQAQPEYMDSSEQMADTSSTGSADQAAFSFKKVRNTGAQIAELIHQWAAAWAAQDVDRYLSYYASNYKPETEKSRSAWQHNRREFIEEQDFIEVKVRQIALSHYQNGYISANFSQWYNSSSFTYEIDKKLVLVKQGNDWKISQERNESIGASL